MAEKGSEKKFLILLSVLAVLILVVDLLSLNIMYDLADNDSSLKGDLASLTFEWGSSGEDCYSTLVVDDSASDCFVGCLYSYNSCEYDNCMSDSSSSEEDCSQYGQDCLDGCGDD